MLQAMKSPRRWLSVVPLALALLAVLAVARPATAGPLFFSLGQVGGFEVRNERVEREGDEPVAVEAIGHPSSGPASEAVLNFARARAGRFLGTLPERPGPIFVQGNSHSMVSGAHTEARVVIDDLVFSGPEEEVFVVPLVHISGFLRAVVYEPPAVSFSRSQLSG